MGEDTKKSDKAAGRPTSTTGRSAGSKASTKGTSKGTSEARKPRADTATRGAAPKAKAKKARMALATKTSKAGKPDARSRKARKVKDEEAPPMVEKKPEIMADPNENQAERRAAGGTESADHASATANGSSSNGTEAPASVDAATPKASSTTPDTSSTTPDTSAPEGAQGASRPGSEAARKTSADQRLKSGEPRPNTLVPTNGIHTTERRLKRRLHQNRTVVFLVAATLLGILILGEQTDPPDMTAFEQRIAAGQDGDMRLGAGSGAPEGINLARVRDAVEAPPARHERAAARGTETGVPNSDPRPTTSRRQRAAVTEGPSGAQPWDLNGAELVEMERLLARLDLEPSSSDGIVDRQTKRAIRLYQQIAGLPVDGEPSQALLTDMREVVKILDSGT